MAYNEYNTVEIDVSDTSPILEGICDQATGISPGMICRLDVGLTSADHYVAQITNDERVPPIIATVNIYQGKSISYPYEKDDRIFLRYGRPGDVFYLAMEPAQSVGKAEKLINYNGYVRASAGVLSVCTFISLEEEPVSSLLHYVKASVI